MPADRGDEQQIVERIAVRLAERFPEVTRETVVSVVTQVHRKFDGQPIRQFIPLLVENVARERLRQGGGTDAAQSHTADEVADEVTRSQAPLELPRFDGQG